MLKRGLFINFEGIDGSGTSTHVHKLEEKIETLNKYQDIIRTHEPWRSKEIKKKLEEDSEIYSDGLEIAELYVEDRTQHTRKIIRPSLENGIIVLNSRYKMSTCTYQWAQGVSLHELLEMHEHRGLIVPDLTFFMDVPAEVARERVRSTRRKLEKFERNPKFIEKLINYYHALIGLSEVDSKVFGKVVRIDGDRSVEQVADEIFSKFLPLYNSWISRNR